MRRERVLYHPTLGVGRAITAELGVGRAITAGTSAGGAL